MSSERSNIDDSTHRVVSVQQPWAGLLVSGVKWFEVRSWSCSVVSRFMLIHASANKADGYSDFEFDPAMHTAIEKVDLLDNQKWQCR